MPSPFPGMDPYLEATGLWESFHTVLITACAGSLNRRLPEPYFAQVETRIELVGFDEPSAQRLPDVAVVRGDSEPSPRPGTGASGIATLEPTTIPLARQEVEVRDRWIEILHLPEMELVTVIEILSPTNKIGSGRSDYLRKRTALIDRPVNLVEIDLLLGGKRMPMARLLPPGDCFAIVARIELRPDAQVYAWTLRQPLPPVPIPLRAPDPDVNLDLAEAFAMAYDLGGYARVLRYGTPLPASFPINPEDRAWAESLGR
ncbi:MAG TPA: DUF4058 family protein [Isosphaeraceae bacterium]|nr:DUF4058 family protein [Isosphaeraceae bacterium]